MMSARGYAAIGLHCPKSPDNVGGALRAAFCYGAAMVAIAGDRHSGRSIRNPLNTPRAERHVPVITGDDLRSMIPFDCVPVAIELGEDAVPLHSFQHPARAFYVFGPEDCTLGRSITEWCAVKVMVPTRVCMNLAATVNVVLYDRQAKMLRSVRKDAA